MSGTLKLARHATSMIKGMKLVPYEQLDDIYPAGAAGGVEGGLRGGVCVYIYYKMTNKEPVSVTIKDALRQVTNHCSLS